MQNNYSQTPVEFYERMDLAKPRDREIGINLVGNFGFNGPLMQYFSLYRAVSRREGDRKCPNNSTRTYCKRSRSLPYSYPSLDAPALEVHPAPLHHPTTPEIGIQ